MKGIPRYKYVVSLIKILVESRIEVKVQKKNPWLLNFDWKVKVLFV